MALGLICVIELAAMGTLPEPATLRAAPAAGPDRGTLPTLTPIEEAIVRQPFASRTARLRMRRALKAPSREELERQQGRGDMEWAIPDRQYWRRIPSAARHILADWSGLPAVRFTNTEIDGERQVALYQGPEYDQWLLHDAYHHLWACISVHRATRRVYFFEMAPRPNRQWRLRVAEDNCYSCHPSGPRVIRPFATRGLDRFTLARFNRLILYYHACDFGQSINLRLRGKPIRDARCVGCHDGVQRGRLYAIHRRAIRFKTGLERTMPPTVSQLGIDSLPAQTR